MAYEAFQNRSPNFLLHASPTLLSISDEFYGRFLELKSVDRTAWSEEQKKELITRLNEALGVLREVIKSELFMTQPRFQVERLIYRRRWNKLSEDNQR